MLLELQLKSIYRNEKKLLQPDKSLEEGKTDYSNDVQNNSCFDLQSLGSCYNL